MNEIAFIGGILLCGLAWFIYTQVNKSRNKKGSPGGSKKGTKLR
jgi:hypothetical protein